MRKFAILISLLFIILTVSSQKLITAINSSNRVEGYFFKYDRSSGSYVYNDYDSTKKKNVLITSKGNSAEYDFEMAYNTLFDKNGNSYTAVYNKYQDSLYKYFLLKNNSEIASYDFMGDGWDINNGMIYFYAKDAGKYYFITYNTSNGEISKGKSYDEIFLANFTEQYYEGEPQGKIGYTNDGRPFYLASNNGEKFFVFGTEEQKHYADIDWYMTKKDNNGDLVYFAKSEGTFYVERGNAFLVQGKKEYRSFDYVSGPVMFDKNNNPVYTASDSLKDYNSRTRIMIGNKEGESFTGNIYEYKLTPSGKLAYVVSKIKGYSGGEDPIYENFLVIDGEEGRHYNSLSNVTFSERDVPAFTASDKSNKYFIVKGDKIISEKYDNIYDYTFMKDGSLAYIGNNFGNYDKQIPDKNFVTIFGKKYGPFEFVTMADYNAGKYIVKDANDNFAFITGKLVNPQDYIYKYKVTARDWESEPYDAIDMANIYNGKVVYVCGETYDRTTYSSKYKLFIDNKAAAEGYDNIIDPVYDKQAGTLSFIGCKDKSFYLLEFKM
jgi:hypothetical protein